MRNTHPTTLGNLDLDSFYVADVTALGWQSSFGFLSALEVLLRHVHREELYCAPRPSISVDLGVFCSPL